MKVFSFLWFSRFNNKFEIVFTLIIFEKLLVFYLDFVFVVNLLIHKIYIQFSRYFVLLSTSGGPGWTRTTGLTLIRRAL